MIRVDVEETKSIIILYMFELYDNQVDNQKIPGSNPGQV